MTSSVLVSNASQKQMLLRLKLFFSFLAPFRIFVAPVGLKAISSPLPKITNSLEARIAISHWREVDRHSSSLRARSTFDSHMIVVLARFQNGSLDNGYKRVSIFLEHCAATSVARTVFKNNHLAIIKKIMMFHSDLGL